MDSMEVLLEMKRSVGAYALFLDDERTPKNPPRRAIRQHGHPEWRIARNPKEAFDTIREHGLPIQVSFDHDLGPGWKNGKQFADELCQLSVDITGGICFVWFVHSANPVGAQNIVNTIKFNEEIFGADGRDWLRRLDENGTVD